MISSLIESCYVIYDYEACVDEKQLEERVEFLPIKEDKIWFFDANLAISFELMGENSVYFELLNAFILWKRKDKSTIHELIKLTHVAAEIRDQFSKAAIEQSQH